MRHSLRNLGILLKSVFLRAWLEKILYRGEENTRARRLNAFKSLVGPLIAFIFFSALSLAFFSVAAAILEGSADREALVSGALAGVTNLICLLVFGASIDTAIKTTFYSNDLTLLERLPISDRVMLSYKMTETTAYAGYSTVVLGVALLMGYGLSGLAADSISGQILFYLTLPVVVVALLLIGVAGSVLAALLVCRFVPQRSVSPALFVLALTFASIFSWLYHRAYGLPNPDSGPASSVTNSMTVPLISRFGALDGVTDATTQILGAMGSLAQPLLTSPILHVPPGRWAAQALTGAGSAAPIKLVAGLAPLLALAAVSTLLCIEVSSRTYTVARSRARSEEGVVKTQILFRAAQRISWLLPVKTQPSFVKECCFMLREVRSMLNLTAVVSIALGLFAALLYALPELSSGLEGGIVGVPPGSRLEDTATFLILALPYVIAVAAGPTAAARAGQSSVGYEGEAYRIYVSSPTSMRSILSGKCAAHALVGFAIAFFATVVVAAVLRSFVLPGLIIGLVGGLLLSTASAMVHIGAGAKFARFDWNNPAHATHGLPHFCFLIIVNAFVILVGGLTGLLIFACGLLISSLPIWLSAAVAGAIYAVLYLGIGLLVLRIGANRLHKMQW